MTDTVRILRLLEYTGPRKQIKEMLEKRHLKCSHEFGYPYQGVTIREAILGEFPEAMTLQKTTYGIGEEAPPDVFAMWDGPTPSLHDLLDRQGRSENSRILRRNPDGTDTVVYRWLTVNDTWECITEL